MRPSPAHRPRRSTAPRCSSRCSPTVPAIEETVPELDPATHWIQMSTVGVADTARFSRRHACYVDAPVLGSKPQAEAGELLVLGAGAERPEKVFDAIASRVLWLADEPGAGTKLKLTTNLWIMNLVENLCETFALAQANGLDPRLFLDAISGRPMDTPYAGMKGEKILSGDSFARVHRDQRGEGRTPCPGDGRRGRDRARPRPGHARAFRARDRTRPRRRRHRCRVVRQPPRLTPAPNRVVMPAVHLSRKELAYD